MLNLKSLPWGSFGLGQDCSSCPPCPNVAWPTEASPRKTDFSFGRRLRALLSGLFDMITEMFNWNFKFTGCKTILDFSCPKAVSSLVFPNGQSVCYHLGLLLGPAYSSPPMISSFSRFYFNSRIFPAYAYFALSLLLSTSLQRGMFLSHPDH